MAETDQSTDGDANVERQQWLDRKREEVEADQATGWHRGMFSGPSDAAKEAPGWEQRHWTSRALHRVGGVAAHSGAGIVATVLVVLWAGVGLICGFPQWWQTVLYSVTGSVTFVMVFVIQHAQERQTSGTQRKLDELIRSSSHADNALIAVEEAPDEHLQALAHLNLADRKEAVPDYDSEPEEGTNPSR
jgi:low affinity Fe/Cu permease